MGKLAWLFLIVIIAAAVLFGKPFYDTNFGSPTIDPDTKFECENDNSITTRGYVYLRGFADHTEGAFDYQRGLLETDPKTKDILDFDYDETQTLNKISTDFVARFNEFTAKNNDLDEIVIIGQRAGGVIAAYSASQLEFSNTIELHTLAAPLKGYGVPVQLLGDFTGFGKEIGQGFDKFQTPAENVKVYHHKLVQDKALIEQCGSLKSFCDPIKVQNNNIAGSKEFYYLEHNHKSIVPAASKIIIECHV